MKIGASQADVDPMQIDCSVSIFSSLLVRCFQCLKAFSNVLSTATLVYSFQQFENCLEYFLCADMEFLVESCHTAAFFTT